MPGHRARVRPISNKPAIIQTQLDNLSGYLSRISLFLLPFFFLRVHIFHSLADMGQTGTNAGPEGGETTLETLSGYLPRLLTFCFFWGDLS